MENHHIGHSIRELLLVMYFCTGSSATAKEYLPSPSNITFHMKGMFDLEWTWQPVKANCTVEYLTTVSNGGKSRRESTIHTERQVDILRVKNPNDVIHFEILAACNDMRSNLVNVNTLLAPGNEKTSVRNVSCIWYYLEYVNCTWQPGEDTSHSISYDLLYWVNDETTNDSILHLAQFHQLLSMGNMCHMYYTSHEMLFGCQFRLQKSINCMSRLVIVITDKSKTIKPYIVHTRTNNIAKLRPPVIDKLHRTENQHLHISWNASVSRNVEYEVLLKISTSEREQIIKDIENLYINIPNAFPDVTYIVKVRIKLSKYKYDGHFHWSEWSEEKKLPGKNSEKTISIILLVLIPSIVCVTTIFLLIYIRRLKTPFFPPVPDPGKIFSPDLQLWIKNGGVHPYCRPQKEEICPVSLEDI